MILHTILEACSQDEIILTFDEIESILQTNIPASIKRKPNQLVTSASYSFAYGWINAGYEIVRSDLNQETIVLRKKK